MEDEQNQGDGLESRTIRLPPELAAWWDETGAETIREGLDEWMQDERRWSAQEAAYWAGRPVEADAEARVGGGRSGASRLEGHVTLYVDGMKPRAPEILVRVEATAREIGDGWIRVRDSDLDAVHDDVYPVAGGRVDWGWMHRRTYAPLREPETPPRAEGRS